MKPLLGNYLLTQTHHYKQSHSHRFTFTRAAYQYQSYPNSSKTILRP